MYLSTGLQETEWIGWHNVLFRLDGVERLMKYHEKARRRGDRMVCKEGSAPSIVEEPERCKGLKP